MVLCLSSPVGKIHLSPSQVHCWTYCAILSWECNDVGFMFWLSITWLASLPPLLLWWNSNLEIDILFELVLKFHWEPIPSLCYFMHQCNCFKSCETIMKLGFLADSFLIEPLNQRLIWMTSWLQCFGLSHFRYAIIWIMCFQILILWKSFNGYHICFVNVEMWLLVK